jgi:hypothetical protein
MLYKLFVPSQAAGASLVYFDLFNAGSTGCYVSLVSVIPVVSGAAQVTGVLSVDVHLTRTTAIGTGGTAATFEGTSLTAATISALDHDQPLVTSLGVTARLTPSGGATAGAVLSWRSLYTEEANAGTYIQIANMVGDRPVPIKGGTGIRVVQGSVASVGNIGFDCTFDLVRR